jgi:hypothetical protein
MQRYLGSQIKRIYTTTCILMRMIILTAAPAFEVPQHMGQTLTYIQSKVFGSACMIVLVFTLHMCTMQRLGNVSFESVGAADHA